MFHSSYFLVYDFSAALLLFKIGTFCVPTEVESGFGILSQNRDCPPKSGQLDTLHTDKTNKIILRTFPVLEESTSYF